MFGIFRAFQSELLMKMLPKHVHEKCQVFKNKQIFGYFIQFNTWENLSKCQIINTDTWKSFWKCDVWRERGTKIKSESNCKWYESFFWCFWRDKVVIYSGQQRRNIIYVTFTRNAMLDYAHKKLLIVSSFMDQPQENVLSFFHSQFFPSFLLPSIRFFTIHIVLCACKYNQPSNLIAETEHGKWTIGCYLSFFLLYIFLKCK